MNLTSIEERRFEIDNLLADTAMEGNVFPPETLALLDRYVSGELSWDETSVLWDELLDTKLATYDPYGLKRCGCPDTSPHRLVSCNIRLESGGASSGNAANSVNRKNPARHVGER